MNYIKGITTRRTRLGVEVVRVHYTAPTPSATRSGQSANGKSTVLRAPGIGKQEIIHDAGGGQLLFAEILNRYADKIIIRDPDFEIPPTWKRIAGFDHRKTNPTAALVVAIDYDGRVYCLCEYYQPGLTPSKHMGNCADYPASLMPRKYSQIRRFFIPLRHKQRGGFKSIAELYSEAGLNGLWEGENAEIAGMERILEHWRDLDYREPTLKIICPHDFSRKRFGLFVDGCPNLLWELMRTRREQLTASQLMRKNPTEAIVDKENHLRDTLKYILLSLPSPTEKPPSQERDEIIREAYARMG